MNKVISSGNTIPQAFISVNKNRQKFYGRGCEERTVYLPNQTNFEIELFNPTQERIGVKIYLNGNYDKELLIIRPGERMFLDRFLSDNKKFLFDVYDVSGKNKEVQKAIENNGSIKIEFYKEYEKPLEYKHTKIDVQPNITIVPLTYPTPVYPHPTYPPFYYHTTGGSKNTVFSSSSDSVSINYCSTGTTNLNTSHSTLTFADSPTLKCTQSDVTTDSVIETGRIEKGEKSNQKFRSTSFEIDYSTPPTRVEYKLLPVSQKPLTNDDLKKSKMFCCQCGAKVKKSDKFCWNCGTKL